MPVFPGDPCARLYQTMSVEKDGFGDHKVEACMHVGTHIDAPLHMIEGGACISDYSLDPFCGLGHLIDARGHQTIDKSFLKDRDFAKGDIVLVWTGYSDKFHEPDYFSTYPALSDDFAHHLVQCGITMVGMDTPSPDYDPFPVHKILLRKDVLIMENLTNLAALEGKRFIVHAYPLKYEAAAAPVRAIAEIL